MENDKAASKTAAVEGEVKPKRDRRRWPPRPKQKATKLKVDNKVDARKDVKPVKPGG